MAVGQESPRSGSRRLLQRLQPPVKLGPADAKVAEVCAELGVARSTFYDWRAAKKAPPCFRLPNGDLRIRRAEFDRWLESLQESA